MSAVANKVKAAEKAETAAQKQQAVLDGKHAPAAAAAAKPSFFGKMFGGGATSSNAKSKPVDGPKAPPPPKTALWDPKAEPEKAPQHKFGGATSWDTAKPAPSSTAVGYAHPTSAATKSDGTPKYGGSASWDQAAPAQGASGAAYRGTPSAAAASAATKLGGASSWVTTNHTNSSAHIKPFNKFAGANEGKFEQAGVATTGVKTGTDYRRS